MSPRNSHLAQALLLALLLALPQLSGGPARAAGVIYCVSQSGGPTTPPCTNPQAFTSIQAAVDRSPPGDEIRVARGTYSGDGAALVQLAGGVLAIAGGYADGDWGAPSPANATVLDGRGAQRLIYGVYTSLRLSDLTLQNGYSGLGGSKMGGALLIEQNQQGLVVLERVRLRTNRSEASGGAAAVFSPLIVLDSEVGANTAAEDGGALWAPEVRVSGGSFVGNSARRNGGAISGAVAVADALFSANVAARGSGGALFINSPEASVSDSSFEQNRAAEFGGAIHRSFQGGAGALRVERSVFRLNRSERFPDDDTARPESGGAIAADTAAGPVRLDIRDSRFEANRAAGASGAILHPGIDGELVVSGCLFQANVSQGPAGAIGLSITGTISRSSFIANEARGRGGAIAQATQDNVMVGRRPLTVEDSSFVDNRATAGGGGAISSREQVRLTRVQLRGNQASGSGGAVFTEPPFDMPPGVTAEGSLLRDNRAGEDGGAIHAYGSVSLRATTIVGNTAGARGGGLFVGGLGLGTSDLELSGVILGDNRGGAEADGVYADAYPITLRNVTIASAQLAPHAALRVPQVGNIDGGPAITLTNTLITSHTIGLERPANATLSGDYNALFAVPQPQRVEGAAQPFAWAHAFSADPRFAAPVAGDFRLSEASPLIGQGSPALSYAGRRDAQGQPIPYGARADVGGDEFAPVRAQVFLPGLGVAPPWP